MSVDGALLAPLSVDGLPPSVLPAPGSPVAVESELPLGAVEASPPPEPVSAGALPGEIVSDGAVWVEGASCTERKSPPACGPPAPLEMPLPDVRLAASRAIAFNATRPAGRLERVFEARCACGRGFAGV